jgi:hypothetical protein
MKMTNSVALSLRSRSLAETEQAVAVLEHENAGVHHVACGA